MPLQRGEVGGVLRHENGAGLAARRGDQGVADQRRRDRSPPTALPKRELGERATRLGARLDRWRRRPAPKPVRRDQRAHGVYVHGRASTGKELHRHDAVEPHPRPGAQQKALELPHLFAVSEGVDIDIRIDDVQVCHKPTGLAFATPCDGKARVHVIKPADRRQVVERR